MNIPTKKQTAPQDQESKRRKPNSAKREKSKSGSCLCVSIKIARQLLTEWLSDLGKADWVQMKIYLPHFIEASKPMPSTHNLTDYFRNIQRAKQIGYQLQINFIPTRLEFCRGYFYLKSHGAELISFTEALKQHPSDPGAMFQALVDSLAAWNPHESPVSVEKLHNQQPAHSVGKILPSIKELKELHGSQVVNDEIEFAMKSSGKNKYEVTWGVRYKLATDEQRELFAVKGNAANRLRREKDAVDKACGQAYAAFKESSAPISCDDFLLIFLAIRTAEKCSYCGDPRGEDGKISLGADRIDSKKTYYESFISGQLCSACWFCNQAKNDLSLQSFIQLAQNVVNFQDYQQPAIVPICPRWRLMSWSLFQKRAKYPIHLTENEFLALRIKPCHHCGLQDPNGSGVDRFDNSPVYDNTAVPSCWPCNRAKYEYSAEYFYEKCRKIVRHQGFLLVD